MGKMLAIVLLLSALAVKESSEVVAIDVAQELVELNDNVQGMKESFDAALRSINDQLTTVTQKLEIILPSRLMMNMRAKNMQSPQNIVRSPSEDNPDDDNDDDDGDLTNVEDDMLSLIRKITVPLRRVRQRKLSVEKIENEIGSIKASMDRSNDELRRTLTDFITSSAEIVQEQNHMIEGLSATLANVLQISNDHSQAFYQFISSSTPVLDKMDVAMSEWRVNFIQRLDRLEQQLDYNMGMLRDNVKGVENVVVEGFDRQWSCDKGNRQTTSRTPTRSTTQRTTTTTQRPTTLATASTTTLLTTTTVELTTEVEQEEVTPSIVMDVESCSQLMEGSNASRRSGVYHFEGMGDRFCDMETDGGGWTVLQRRGGVLRHINFTRTWAEYKAGFGEMGGEFWLGNDDISELTMEPMLLRIELVAHDGRTAFAEYSTFRVDSEAEDYRIWVGGYSGNASDSLSAHNGYKFSTIDRNNDHAPKCCPCAPAYGGGWWFYSCFEANLNGEYFSDPEDNGYYRGIIWELWLGDYSLKETRMMIRPVNFNSAGVVEDTESRYNPDP